MQIYASHKPNVEVAFDIEALSQRGVDHFIAGAGKAIGAKNAFYVALSGGHTPRRFFQLLGESSGVRALPWDRVHLFWVDERYVAPESPASNYKLAADTFLEKVAIPAGNIHRIPTEYSDLDAAARRYETTIREVFGLEEGKIPKFDLILLGMGKDGHTGSLFPNCYARLDTDNLACVVYCVDEDLARITMTHPVLTSAEALVVMVAGEEKARVLKEVLTSEQDEVRYPIHLLWPVLEKVTWLVDRKAAQFL